MDASAISLMRDNDIPIVVFSIRERGNLLKVLKGEGVFTDHRRRQVRLRLQSRRRRRETTMAKPVSRRYKDRMDKAVAALKDEFGCLRTGRAWPACSTRSTSRPTARPCRQPGGARSACPSRA